MRLSFFSRCVSKYVSKYAGRCACSHACIYVRGCDPIHIRNWCTSIFSSRTENRYLRPAIVALLLLAVTGCGNEVRRQVPAEFRDTSGRFDGVWLAQMLDTPSPQLVQNWRINCQSFGQAIPISVTDGRVEAKINDAVHWSYLSVSGRFRLEIPTGLRMSSPTSSDSLADGRVTLILQGDLSREPRRGKFTFGIAQFANAGCTTTVRYEPVADSP